MALPYHLADLYIRSALAEFWAFMWLPVVCFFLEKVRERAVPYSVGLFHIKGFSFDYVESLIKQNWNFRSDSSEKEIFKSYNFYFNGNVWLVDVPNYRPLWSVQKFPCDTSPDSKGDNKKVLEDYQ
jgi:hypothetical protein